MDIDIYEKMKELAIRLPTPPTKGGVYAQVKRFGNGLLYVSGCGPAQETPVQGKLGQDFGIAEGQRYARDCMLNILAIVEAHIGDLRKIKNCVKILTMVSCTTDFYEQPAVANGGSQLLIDLFGPEKGAPSRSAFGVNALPGNIPVETEALFEIDCT
jgi:enamine deaminase RidA (YjgF/YER057c/UK114 family)